MIRRFPQFSKTQLIIFFAVLTLLTLAVLIGLHVYSVPSNVEDVIGETHLQLSTSLSRILYPHQCVDLSWNVEGVRTIQINGKGQVGQGMQTICDSTIHPHVLRAELPDGSIEEQKIWVQRLYHEPGVFLVQVVFLVALTLTLYLTFGAAVALIPAVVIFTWPSLNFFVHSTHNEYTDFAGHIAITQGIMDGSRPLPPHFLYHMLTIGLVRLFPNVSLTDANYWILIASNIATCISIYALLRVVTGVRPDTNWKWTLFYLAVPLLLFVGPLNFIEPFVLRSAYIYPNTPHNPTINFLRPFAVGIVLCLAVLMRGQTDRHCLLVAALALLTVLATLAKPSFTLPLLAVAGLLFVYSWVKPFSLKWWEIAAGLIAPAVAVLGWQYLLTYGPDQINLYNTAEKAGLQLAPLELYLTEWKIPVGALLPQLLLSIVFPLAVYVLYFQQARKDALLNIAWLIFIAGQALAYLFIEVPNRFHGNMTWSGRITLFVLFVATLSFFINQNKPLLEKRFSILTNGRFMLGTALLLLQILPSMFAFWAR